jgi:hypothetical protein
MRTVRIIEGLDYPRSEPSEPLEHHLLTCEIISRLQELDELLAGNESRAPGGIRLLHRLCAVERRSRRAYRLLLDMLSQQRSLSESLESLASRHSNRQGSRTSRQSWLQNAQADVVVISEVWSDVGEVMSELIKRRPPSDV